MFIYKYIRYLKPVHIYGLYFTFIYPELILTVYILLFYSIIIDWFDIGVYYQATQNGENNMCY